MVVVYDNRTKGNKFLYWLTPELMIFKLKLPMVCKYKALVVFIRRKKDKDVENTVLIIRFTG